MTGDSPHFCDEFFALRWPTLHLYTCVDRVTIVVGLNWAVEVDLRDSFVLATVY